MKKIFYLSLACIGTLNCSKSIEPAPPIYEEITETCTQESKQTREFQPMALGEQLENPFSVENMKLALDLLKSDPKNDDPYGKKGESRWQQIALIEGWGKYREWKLSKEMLGMDIFPIKYDIEIYKNRQQTFDDYPNEMNIYYGGMFHSLNLIGCSYGNMEKSLSVFSIVNFKNNLIRYYPNLKTKIETIIKRYE